MSVWWLIGFVSWINSRRIWLIKGRADVEVEVEVDVDVGRAKVRSVAEK
jgi:hypothetical protein